MAYQATLKSKVVSNSSDSATNDRNSGNGVVGSLSIFGNDVANLIELQAKLAAYDLQDCKERLIRPLIGLVVGVVLLLGAIPLVLFGVAELLATAANLSWGASLLIVGLSAMVVAAAVAYFCVVAVTRSTESFRRSKEEFVRNISWLRTVVIHSGRR